ncbi:MAG: hypothetical protein ACREMK_10735 [Gemmatimonadota bacterium]
MNRDLPTKDMFENYFAELHGSYRGIVDDHLSENDQRFLAGRFTRLTRPVVCYVSSTHGSGYEYVSGESHSITDLVISHFRIEDLLLGHPRDVRRWGARGYGAITPGANWHIENIHFEDSYPFRLELRRSSIRIVNCHFEALGWWHRDIDYAEMNGDNRGSVWTTNKAMEKGRTEAHKDVAQLLTSIRRAEKLDVSLSTYWERFNKKVVLVLGDYGTRGRKRLKLITTSLTELGYDPLLLEDCPDIGHHFTLERKLLSIAPIVRFIVVDDSSKAGHNFEMPIVRNMQRPFAVLRLEGSKGSYMTHGMGELSRVIREWVYTKDGIRDTIKEAVEWAEGLIDGLQSISQSYPWTDRSS